MWVMAFSSYYQIIAFLLIFRRNIDWIFPFWRPWKSSSQLLVIGIWLSFISLKVAGFHSTVIKDASSTKFWIMLLLNHNSLLPFVKVIVFQISKLFQDSITDRKCCHINELFGDVLGLQHRSIESKNTRVFLHIAAVNTILLISYNTHKYFILHK